jgi:hypothetical protein
MWITAEEANLDKETINKLCELAWVNDNKDANRKCNDCGVKPGQVHKENCDVARCASCGVQLLQADFLGCNHDNPDVWTGLWPNTKECYENKLICCWGDATTLAGLRSGLMKPELLNWGFNYNEVHKYTKYPENNVLPEETKELFEKIRNENANRETNN